MSHVGGATGQTTPISRSALEMNPMPGHLFEGNPVGEGTTRRGTDTPEHLLEIPAGSTHSSTTPPYKGGWSHGEAEDASPSCPDTALLPFLEAWALGPLDPRGACLWGEGGPTLICSHITWAQLLTGHFLHGPLPSLAWPLEPHLPHQPHLQSLPSRPF